MQLPHIPGLPGALGGRLASLASLATFIRDRLTEVGDSLAPLWTRRDDGHPALTGTRAAVAAGGAHEAASVIVAAAAPFAPTSFARARLLRQMHASGLLSERETEQAEQLLGVAR
ncbi:MAG: hypothetical protein ACRDVG_04085 [Jatrophihabitantaceae bacterium]